MRKKKREEKTEEKKKKRKYRVVYSAVYSPGDCPGRWLLRETRLRSSCSGWHCCLMLWREPDRLDEKEEEEEE